MAGMAGMAGWQKEWQNGRMAEMATYVLFMVHTDDNDTLIFYITDKPIGASPGCDYVLTRMVIQII